MTNHLITGCATGGLISMPAGIYGMIPGCVGFMTFSYVIERFMEPEHPHEPLSHDETLILLE